MSHNFNEAQFYSPDCITINNEQNIINEPIISRYNNRGMKNRSLEASRSTHEHILILTPIERVYNNLDAGHSKVSIRGLFYHLSNI